MSRDGWVSVTGLPKYEINAEGQVRHYRTKRVLSPWTYKGSAPKVTLNTGLVYSSKRRPGEPDKITAYVHRLIAAHFLEDYDEAYIVEFIDGNRNNARVDNLKMSKQLIRGPRPKEI